MRSPPRVLAGVILLIGLVACRGTGTSARASLLTVAVRADVTGIFPNPPIRSESFTFDINANVFEGLVGRDAGLRLEPALADRWETVDDETWIFHLKPGLRFSNGTPVTASDVETSLRAALDRPLVNGIDLSRVRAVRARGEDAVEIQTRGPFPVLPSHLVNGFVLPRRLLEQNPVPPVGSGAFVLESWRPGHEIRLRRNHFYRGRAPAFERVRLLVVPDAAERVHAVVTGVAQVADHVPLADIERLERQPNLRVVSRPGLFVLFLAFRMDGPPFSDPALREAVDLALDRDALIRRVFHGRAVAATQLVPPAVAGYNVGLRSPKVDLPRARALLAQSGHASGLSLTLDGTSDRYVNDVETLQEVARQLGVVGIRVAVRAMPKRDFESHLSSGQARFYMLGWSCDTLHAGDALDGLMHSQASVPPGNQNYQGLSDLELDRLIEEGDRAADAQRTKLHAQALARVASLRAIVPLVIQPETVAFARSLGWEPPLNFALRFAEMEPRARP